MIVKLHFLILALALLTVTSNGQDNYRPKKKDLSWGVKADGLRMSAWTNPATDKVFFAVRNFSTKKICYCDPEFNNFTVKARKNAASQWQELKFKAPSQEVIFLTICNTKTLRQNEEMTFYALQNEVGSKKNYLDLREYSFPADWNGAVEAKIIQRNVYCPKTKNINGEVESQTFEIKLPFTGAAAQRKRRNTTNHRM